MLVFAWIQQAVTNYQHPDNLNQPDKRANMAAMLAGESILMRTHCRNVGNTSSGLTTDRRRCHGNTLSVSNQPINHTHVLRHMTQQQMDLLQLEATVSETNVLLIHTCR